MQEEMILKEIELLRKMFDELVGVIMREQGYDDIDEGNKEAITEKLHGAVKLFRKDGDWSQFDIWIYDAGDKKVTIRNWSETLIYEAKLKGGNELWITRSEFVRSVEQR